MPDWIHNKDATFVIAAYGAAFVALAGVLIVSLREYRRRVREWHSLQSRDEPE